MTFNVTINYSLEYTPSSEDHENMLQTGYVPGDAISEKAWLEDMVRMRPEMLIEQYVKEGAALGAWSHGEKMKLPASFAAVVQVP